MLIEHGVQIAPRTFHAWAGRAPSKRALWEATITEVLAGYYEPDEDGRRKPESLYGSSKMWAHRQREGIPGQVHRGAPDAPSWLKGRAPAEDRADDRRPERSAATRPSWQAGCTTGFREADRRDPSRSSSVPAARGAKFSSRAEGVTTDEKTDERR